MVARACNPSYSGGWERELPEPRRRRLRWAEITPLHSSLGNKSETPSQKKKSVEPRTWREWRKEHGWRNLQNFLGKEKLEQGWGMEPFHNVSFTFAKKRFLFPPPKGKFSLETKTVIQFVKMNVIIKYIFYHMRPQKIFVIIPFFSEAKSEYSARE